MGIRKIDPTPLKSAGAEEQVQDPAQQRETVTAVESSPDAIENPQQTVLSSVFGQSPEIRAMYGIALREDITRFQTEISKTISDVQLALQTGQFSGDEKVEVQKTLENLNRALQVLNPGFFK